MKKALLILFFQIPILAISQSNSVYNSIGMGVGRNTPVGVWGVFYAQGVSIKSGMLEVKGGIGLEEGFVMSGGFGLRILKKNDKLEIFGEVDYSHHFSGTIEYEENNITDIYNTSSISYIHSSINFRYFVDYFLILQIQSGYSFLVSNPIIQHQYGPNLNYDNTNKRISNGFMLGLNIIIPLKF